jgi:hypothetical protein
MRPDAQGLAVLRALQYQNQLRPGIRSQPRRTTSSSPPSTIYLSLPWSFVAQLLDGRTATDVNQESQ